MWKTKQPASLERPVFRIAAPLSAMDSGVLQQNRERTDLFSSQSSPASVLHAGSLSLSLFLPVQRVTVISTLLVLQPD